MKRCILTPTYKGHFDFIKKYLFSINKFLIDKDFPICFIVDKIDQAELNEIICPYSDKLNINIVSTEEIFLKYGILDKPADVLRKYGRLSFQTLKKLYGCLFLNYNQYLIIDSESLFVQDVCLNDEFDKYFKNKYIFYSEFDDRNKEYFRLFTYNFIVTASEALSVTPSYLALESYHWFYDRKIIEDIIKNYGDIFCMVKNVKSTDQFHDEGLIDSLLYYMFIRKHNECYNYNFINVNTVLKEYLGKKEYATFVKLFSNSFRKHGGYLEGVASFVTEKNLNSLVKFVKNYELPLFRVSKIISQDMKCLDENSQIKFIDEANIKLLTSSYPDVFYELLKRGNQT